MLDILSSDAMRDGLKRGMQVTADASAVTLGPCARPVVVGDPLAPLRVAQTGLAVAMSMHFEDRAETTGAALLRQVADWARESAGDGTASAIAVAHLILRESVNLVSIGFDPSRLRRGIDAALVEADRHLSLLARPVEDCRTFRQVAASTAADAELAALVADAADSAGNLVVVEEAKDNGLLIENSGGVRIAAGYAAPQVMTSGGRNRDRHRLDRPLVLVVRGSLQHEDTLAPILDHARRAHRSLLVVADQIPSGAGIAFLQRARKLGVRSLAVQVPQDLARGPATVIRLAALVGATVCDSANGELPTIEHLGEAGTVLADASRTLVLPAAPDDCPCGDGDTGDTITVLRVPARAGDGGDTRVRAERAAQAVHSAALHGVVPGGGVALLSAAAALAAAGRTAPDGEARLAFSIVQRALEEPFRQLVQNAGIAPVSAMRRLHRRDDLDFAGLSLPSGEVVNVVAAGILDPLPVLQGVLHAASCAARLLLTTEAVAAHGRDTAARELELRRFM